MALHIKFDSMHNACPPTLVLANRNGKKLGAIPARHIIVRDPMNSYTELRFSVYKKENGRKYHLWDSLKDFKLAYCVEWDAWFELSVETNESNETVKNVLARSLGEAELSQIRLYDVEINTEIDISREDYVPTILYHESEQKASLLNRILEKAPHYTIEHVDYGIANIQRTFSFDNISIYDAFQEIAQELGCIFVINPGSNENGSIKRSISVYDLESRCLDCGHRDSFDRYCPVCGSRNVLHGYGEDTNIFVSVENLADDITYSTDVDSVKNCFKLKAGDDLMTATVVNCNPNGTGYIWYLSDALKEDMSAPLAVRIASYDREYDYYQSDSYEANVSSNLISEYNALVSKYLDYSDSISEIPSPILGYHSLMNAYYNAIDLSLFLTSGLMPKIDATETTAAKEIAKLNSGTLSSVAVHDLPSCSEATATSSVLATARVVIDRHYQVKIIEDAFNGSVWTGKFIVTNYSDENDTATSNSVSITITDDYEKYVEQRLDRELIKAEDEFGIVGLFKKSDSLFKTEIKNYSLNRLISFRDACQACLDILIEQGIASKSSSNEEIQGLYDELYLPYYNKLGYINEEVDVRKSEIAIVTGAYDEYGELKTSGIKTEIENERDRVRNILDFEKYLGDDLLLEFASYRREDVYQNSNYISDGLDNTQLFENALQFIETAKKDIVKSATLQHSITSTLKNLLVMKEFTPILDKFEAGNWIRVKVDNTVYKLRLLDYEINFDELDNLPVTFSDVKSTASGISDIESILNQAVSMAGSYDYIQHQAEQGNDAQKTIDRWLREGLNSALVQIQNNDNEEITIDKNGLLCRSFNDITSDYSSEQLKLTHNILAYTDDNWRTVKQAVGKHDYVSYDSSQDRWGKLNGYGMSSEFVSAGQIMGSTIVGGKVYSANYHKGEAGSATNAPQGSYIDLETGNFELGGDRMTFDGDTLTLGEGSRIISSEFIGGRLMIGDENSTYAKIDADGTLTCTNAKINGTITGSAIIGGSLLIGDKSNTYAQIDENGTLACTNASINGTIRSSVIEGGSLLIGNKDGTYAEIDSDGKLTCTSANINGTIESSTIKGGSLSIGDNKTYAKISDTGELTCANATINGTIKGSAIEGGSLSIGDGSTYARISGTGELTCSNAKINGKITGSVIEGGSLSIGGKDIYSLISDSGELNCANAKINGSITGSTFIGGSIKSTNYQQDVVGTFIDLDDGYVDIGGGSFVYSDDDGTLSLGKKDEAMFIKLCGGVGKIGYLYVEDNNGNVEEDGLHISSDDSDIKIRTYDRGDIHLYAGYDDLKSVGWSSRIWMTPSANLEIETRHWGLNDETSEPENFASGIRLLWEYLTLYAPNAYLYLKDGVFRPSPDNAISLGTPDYRWQQLYAGNSTIQTSDEREKENIVPLGENTMSTFSLREEDNHIDIHSELFDRLQPVQYNLINGNGRTCYGLVAQQVAESMEELGIGEDELDLIHHDHWTDSETGKEKDLYGIAYTNLTAMLIHEVQKLKAKNDLLEERLSALEIV